MILFVNNNYYEELTAKDAINKAKIEYDYTIKNNNIGLAEKIAANLKSHLDSINYNWKKDPYAIEILSDYIETK